MPIERLLQESELTPEDQGVLRLAFSRALSKLHLVDRNDPICEMVARKVIEVRKAATLTRLRFLRLPLGTLTLDRVGRLARCQRPASTRDPVLP